MTKEIKARILITGVPEELSTTLAHTIRNEILPEGCAIRIDHPAPTTILEANPRLAVAVIKADNLTGPLAKLADTLDQDFQLFDCDTSASLRKDLAKMAKINSKLSLALDKLSDAIAVVYAELEASKSKKESK